MNLEDINEEQEKFNEFLKKKELHLKKKVTFTTDDKLDNLIKELLYSDNYVEENDKEKL